MSMWMIFRPVSPMGHCFVDVRPRVKLLDALLGGVPRCAQRRAWDVHGSRIERKGRRCRMRWAELDGEACSMARTIGVIGDRWTLLILRDCFLRVRRFEDFQARLGIGRPILADRLEKLVERGVLAKVAYQERPLRCEYRLTPMGL